PVPHSPIMGGGLGTAGRQYKADPAPGKSPAHCQGSDCRRQATGTAGPWEGLQCIHRYQKEQYMPEQQLRAQLEALQPTLDDPEFDLSAEERRSLEEPANNLEARLLVSEANEESVADPSLADGFTLLVEDFAERYPTLSPTLRIVVQTLSNMGI